MSASFSKRKDKLDLSKLTAKELLLIGESQTLGNSGINKSISRSSRQSSSDNNEDDHVGEITSDDEEEEEDDSNDSENDWEEVDDHHVEAELQKFEDSQIQESLSAKLSQKSSNEASQASSIPEGGLEIVIPKEGVFKKKSKHQITIEDIIRREINRDRAEFQLKMHQTSLLCQIARGLQLNYSINSESVRQAIEERIKHKSFSSTKHLDLAKLEKLMKWFRVEMLIYKPSMLNSLEVTQKALRNDEFLTYQIMERTYLNFDNYVMISAAFLRHLQIEVRLVIAIDVIPIKPSTSDLIRKPKRENEQNDEKNVSASTKKSKTKKVPEERKKSGKNTGRKMISSSEEEEEDEKRKRDKKNPKAEPVKVGQDMWIEVFLIEEERWISMDVMTGKVICDKYLETQATQPLTYVLAFNNEGKIKDVTRRYASDWLTGTQKLRVHSDWLKKALKPYRGRRTARDKEEDEFLDEHLLSLPIPKSMSEIKGHPLFVLRRHLLKFEALYPQDPPSVGEIKGEPIYSRDYVHNLHTRELWMREAKVVRIGEKPYKIVKGRPKYDKLTGARLPETPSELFGEWQTEDYIPPIAQNGKVPRNDWGNVELFNEKLLPQGCVHLRLPGLQRVAKKLDIDCAPAVVGFDYGAGGSRPAFDGFVVCKEFEETLIDAWNQEQDEKKKREEERRLQRIYTNWRKLIKGVLIRDRLEKKYSVNLSGKRKNDKEPQPSTSKKRKK